MVGKRRGRVLLILCMNLFLLGFLPVNTVMADTVSIQTTLSDGAIQRGSKKTFDVWARDTRGDKVSATVAFNGNPVSSTWDDSDKTSYTLDFTKEGINTVVVSAESDGQISTVCYTITYQRANVGECIGQAVWSVELNTIGCGYLVEPTHVDILEGETAAQILLKLLQDKGYAAYYGGSPQKGFYLAYIADGDKTNKNYNGYILSPTPVNKRKLDLNPAIPGILYPNLQRTMTFFDDTDYESNWRGYIGEFVFTNGSGWMYSINNIFPNVGFSDSYLSDGDVVRVQFTLAYGADIGGTSVMGADSPDIDLPKNGFYAVANKDNLTKVIADVNDSGSKNESAIRTIYQDAVNIAGVVNAAQANVNAADAALKRAFGAISRDNTVISEKSDVLIPETDTTGSGKAGNADKKKNTRITIHPEEITKNGIGTQGSGKSHTQKPGESESAQRILTDSAVTAQAVLNENKGLQLKKRELTNFLLLDGKPDKNKSKTEKKKTKENKTKHPIQYAIVGVTGSVLLLEVILIVHRKNRKKGEKDEV